jgi:flavin reductase (DIM6/NTAB) family NADH-FMN oxidoreductase RutF
LAEGTLTILPERLSPRDAYKLITSIIIPRPIAWVSTIGADGTPNLAPFSFFNGVSGNPPIVMVSVGQGTGKPKDTLRNARETGEFVVNMVDVTLLQLMDLTSAELPYEVNEFDFAGIPTAPSVDIRPCRVAAAPIAMETRVTQIVPVEGTRFTMILGQVMRFHLREGLLRSNGLVDAERLKPVARLGGDEYEILGSVFSLPRPR